MSRDRFRNRGGGFQQRGGGGRGGLGGMRGGMGNPNFRNQNTPQHPFQNRGPQPGGGFKPNQGNQPNQAHPPPNQSTPQKPEAGSGNVAPKPEIKSPRRSSSPSNPRNNNHNSSSRHKVQAFLRTKPRLSSRRAAAQVR
ncbi:splicing factor, proline- and glutamine-rich-like, partial [Colossoma macropomum]|uniref:splicing factor, proline- and glutamine-rich-like n=1 Tax=Colossoma macropomum TaxID=42526 RepID=UPI00186472AA